MATEKSEVVVINPVVMKTATITIVGDTPLIVHKWSEKAKRTIFDPRYGKKMPRNMFSEAASTLWWMDVEKDPFAMSFNGGAIGTYEDLLDKHMEYTEEDYIRDVSRGSFGFPANAIKKAAVSAAYRNGISKDKVSLQGLFFIEGTGKDELVEILHDGMPSIRKDNVNVGLSSTRAADLRYRAMFDEWKMDITIRYNKNGKYTLSDIVNIINLGGQSCGIGEWRVEKGGQYGMFHVSAK